MQTLYAFGEPSRVLFASCRELVMQFQSEQHLRCVERRVVDRVRKVLADVINLNL